MDNKKVKEVLGSILSQDQIFENEPLNNHTTFRVGGKADFLVTPDNEEQIVGLIKALKGQKYIVIGNGSNILFDDKGYDGVVIDLSSKFTDIKVQGTDIIAKSGARLSNIAAVAAKHSLTGFEFAAGIPGTIGGAVAMNAGAYGGEMKDVVVSTTCVTEDGNVIEVTDHDFSYRHSMLTGTKTVALSTVIHLEEGDQKLILEQMKDLANRRKEKQPLEYPSAGSTFKRPEGYYAGKLIDDAGLRGCRIGGAMVSEKHCGFVINYDNATFDDVLKLIDHIKSQVYMQFGVELEPEVKIIERD